MTETANSIANQLDSDSPDSPKHDLIADSISESFTESPAQEPDARDITMSISRPVTPTKKHEKNAAKSFLNFLLRLNANRGATKSGIAMFFGFVLMSIAIHVVLVDLIGILNIHKHFDMPKQTEVAIELVAPDPIEPIPPKILEKAAALPVGKTPESWPISERLPSASKRIARLAEVDSAHSQSGLEAPAVEGAKQDLSSGIANGKPNQTATQAGINAGNFFDSDSSGGGLGGDGGTAFPGNGAGMEDDRTIGACRPSMERGGGMFMFRFHYQTFFKPETLPEGRFRNGLLKVWIRNNFLGNVRALKTVYSDMENNVFGSPKDLYAPLLALVSYCPEEEAEEYQKKFTDLTEKLYGRYSPEAVSAKIIVLESEDTTRDTISQMEDLMRSINFELDKPTLNMGLIHRCFGNMYVSASKYREAQKEYKKSLAILQSLPRNEAIADEIAMTQISLACLEIGKFDNFEAGQPLLNAAKEYAKKTRAHPWMVPLCDLVIADGLRGDGHPFDANELYKQVVEATPGMDGDSIWNTISIGAHFRLENFPVEYVKSRAQPVGPRE